MPQTKQWSYWEQSVFFDKIDVAIIGAGIVGINAAIRLRELNPDWKIAILERGTLPYGASTRNAGFACFGSMTELLDDLQSHSESAVFALVQKRWTGLQRLRQRVGDEALQYKNYGAYELFPKKEVLAFEASVAQLNYFNQILKTITNEKEVFRIKDEKVNDFGFAKVDHLIYNAAEGQLNPGEMMKRLWAIARSLDIEIYTGIEVKQIENEEQGIILNCNHELLIKASKVLLATNGFTKRLLPDLQVEPARNQVLITKPIKNLRFNGCFHYDKGYFYFRNVGNRVLLGGGRNLAKEEEATDNFGHTSLIQEKLIELMNTVILPDTTYEVEQWWSGILGVGDQKQSIVKKVADNIYTAVRLGGMGVAIGTLIGEEAAELITES